ncbi:hypothetical protein ABTX81_19750 [Kitasatospora sp. NPDC097605]|uniref:hypothetical protein n=1 Tax=Kitasatospora sp. NPDC097605 TaxID=3157226 RepID=UPI00331FB9A1
MTATPGARSVTATPGTKPANGAWAAVTVTPEAASRLRVDGKPLLLGASGAFHFTSNSGALDSSVGLTAADTRLRCDGRPVLLTGDATSDSYGNTLTAAEAGRLWTERRPA